MSLMGMFSSLPSSVLTSTMQPTSACKAQRAAPGAAFTAPEERKLGLAPSPRLALYLSQGDGGNVSEVVVVSLKPRVDFLLDDEGDISWNDIWALKIKENNKDTWKWFGVTPTILHKEE